MLSSTLDVRVWQGAVRHTVRCLASSAATVNSAGSSNSNTADSHHQQQLDEVLRRLNALEERLNSMSVSPPTSSGGAGGGDGGGVWGDSNQQQTSTSKQQTPTSKQQHAKGKQHEGGGGSSSGNGSTTEQMADKAAGVMEDAASDAVQRLHPALIKFLNSGYLVSQQQLRQRLMQVEWEGSLRVVAQRQGLAEFEHWLAEKGEEQGISVEWSQLQALYRDPKDTSILADNPRARTLAHAMITKAMLDKQLETYRACTESAKQLANVIDSGQRTGASTLLGALRKLLPIPFLR